MAVISKNYMAEGTVAEGTSRAEIPLTHEYKMSIYRTLNLCMCTDGSVVRAHEALQTERAALERFQR